MARNLAKRSSDLAESEQVQIPVYWIKADTISTLTDFPTLAVTAKSPRVTIHVKPDWRSDISETVTKRIASGIGALELIWHPVPQACLHQPFFQAWIFKQ